MKSDKPEERSTVDTDLPVAPPPVATLASYAYASIRNDIMSGRLRPEEKLRIEFLRRQYGIGATPLREALNRLVTHGFVELRDRHGFRVTGLSQDDLRELTQTRCVLESACLRQSIECGGEEWRREVRAALDRLLAAERQDDGPATGSTWDKLHREFHMALVSACGSKALTEFCELQFDRAERYRVTSIAILPERDVDREHEKIADAVIAGDADKACMVLCDHYRKTRDIILSQIDEAE